MKNKQLYKVYEKSSTNNSNREYKKLYHPVRMRKSISIILSILFMLTICCSERTNPDKEITRTLTPNERYLVNLYVKIHEFERNLQNNPEELTKKLIQIEKETDYQRIRQTLSELEKDPTRWLAVYNRINKLLTRNSQESEN